MQIAIMSPPEGGSGYIEVAGKVYDCAAEKSIPVNSAHVSALKAAGWALDRWKGEGRESSLAKLHRRAMNARRPRVNTGAATVTGSASTDGALAKQINFAASAALTSDFLNNFDVLGGVPKVVNNTKVGFPVTSVSPANGNLNTYTAGGNNTFTADQSAWNWAVPFTHVGDVLEVAALINNANRINFMIDGEYVSLDGYTGAGASPGAYFWKLDMGTRRARDIVILGTEITCLYWVKLKAAADQVYKTKFVDLTNVCVLGDSFCEGWAVSASSLEAPARYPRATWINRACELNGWLNVHQCVAGSTGLISTGGGTRPRLRTMIANTVTPRHATVPFDLFIISHGHNDIASPAADVTAEMLYCLGQLRTLARDAVILVYGVIPGATGPSAAMIATENAIAAAVEAFGDPLCRFIPVSTATVPYMSGTGYDGATNGTDLSNYGVSTDGQHLNVQGSRDTAGERAAGDAREAILSMMQLAA